LDQINDIAEPVSVKTAVAMETGWTLDQSSVKPAENVFFIDTKGTKDKKEVRDHCSDF